MDEKLKIGILYSFLPLNRNSVTMSTAAGRTPVVHHGQHKDVDVGAAELPVGPVYGQTKRAFYGQQAEDDARDEVKVEFGEKALDSPQTRRRLRRRVKNGWQEAEAHCFCFAQGHDKQRYELDMGKVDVFS